MSELTQKWAIIALLDPVDEGYEFHWKNNIPVHVTLAGVFSSDLSGTELYEKLNKVLETQAAFEVQAGETVYWGDNREIEVVLMQDSDDLTSLLMKIHNLLMQFGCIYNEPQYEGENNVLHSTVQTQRGLKRGETVGINKIALIDMFPNSDGYQRRITKTITLKGQYNG